MSSLKEDEVFRRKSNEFWRVVNASAQTCPAADIPDQWNSNTQWCALPRLEFLDTALGETWRLISKLLAIEVLQSLIWIPLVAVGQAVGAKKKKQTSQRIPMESSKYFSASSYFPCSKYTQPMPVKLSAMSRWVGGKVLCLLILEYLKIFDVMPTLKLSSFWELNPWTWRYQSAVQIKHYSTYSTISNSNLQISKSQLRN